MRWVKETLPPRPRARWLLITIRLSISSFAETARTDVAVGTRRLASMLATVREAAPRSLIAAAPPWTGSAWEASLSIAGAPWAACAACAACVAFAAWAAWVAWAARAGWPGRPPLLVAAPVVGPSGTCWPGRGVGDVAAPGGAAGLPGTPAGDSDAAGAVRVAAPAGAAGAAWLPGAPVRGLLASVGSGR